MADLVIDGNQLIILNPETNYQAYAKHSCTPDNCRSCAFERTGFFRRIIGCSECRKIIEEGKSAGCLHGINSGSSLPILEAAKTLSKLAAGV